MAVKYKFDITKIIQAKKNELIDKINFVAMDYLEEVNRLTPEDTQTLLRNNRIKPAHREWKSIVASVYNATRYAYDVEFGFHWIEMNYHKPKWITVYRGVGNRTFARALDNKREKIIIYLSR